LKRNLGCFGENLEFLRAELPEASALRTSENITVVTYFRLILDKLIPKEINRIIYFDPDILIVGSLQELWTTKLERYILAAAIDAYIDKDLATREKIGLAPFRSLEI
jgi:lipopolysaccharide biosynthesis glycosyltransferase